jgi:hypothetical protein
MSPTRGVINGMDICALNRPGPARPGPARFAPARPARNALGPARPGPAQLTELTPRSPPALNTPLGSAHHQEAPTASKGKVHMERA